MDFLFSYRFGPFDPVGARVTCVCLLKAMSGAIVMQSHKSIAPQLRSCVEGTGNTQVGLLSSPPPSLSSTKQYIFVIRYLFILILLVPACRFSTMVLENQLLRNSSGYITLQYITGIWQLLLSNFCIVSIYTAGEMLKRFRIGTLLKGTMAVPFLGIEPANPQITQASQANAGTDPITY
uniref:Uncharacterized protein n=1 Tax=Anguilla anguilla TaxID=7936 RepID=A0A0E9XJB4_ANGAN